MKKFRALFLAVAVTAAGSTPGLLPAPAHADSKSPKTGTSQTGKRRGGMHNQMEVMAKYLELTDKQKAKIKPILDQAQQRTKKVRADKSLSPEQKRARMRAIREETWKKINPILTDAQRKKIAAMRQKRGSRNQTKGKR